MDLKLIDNKGTNTLEQLIKENVTSDSKISIQTAAFSIFAFNALQKELKRSKELRVILTKSFFEREETGFLKRYEIAQSEEDISGNHYEIKLRNKMDTAFIAREIAKLITEKVKIHQLNSNQNALDELLVENNKEPEKNIIVPSMFKFTSDGLGITESNNVSSMTGIIGAEDHLKLLKADFDQVWSDPKKSKDATEKVLEKVRTIYQENSPEWIYFVSLYHIFHDKLEELDEQDIAPDGSGFKDSVIWNKLYQFQKDGVMGLIRKLEKYNGAILADSVGLGKTFSALAVIKYYELQRKRVLVLAPKRLRDNWTVYTTPDKRNILNDDYFNYTVLNHTDLSRYRGMSGEIKLDTFLWSDFDLVVIDESHNFRNNDTNVNRETKTRYERLMDDIIKAGRRTKVLMLSATPVNNRMKDLKNQIGFITEGDTTALADYGIKDIDTELRLAQKSFNDWMELEENERTTQKFLDSVNPGYFKLLDMLTIARSRKHIEKYYDTDSLGDFPERLKPITVKSDIDATGKFPPLQDVYDKVGGLTMAMYQPLQYVLPAKRKYYEDLYDTKVQGGKSAFKQADREQALAKLIQANLFKRLESSIYSFGLTIERMVDESKSILQKAKSRNIDNSRFKSISDFDDEELDSAFEDSSVGKKTKILIGDMDLIRWSQDLEEDLEVLEWLKDASAKVTANKDAKLLDLKKLLRAKYGHPINGNNKKVIIFTAFADTANYLYEHLASIVKARHGLNSALITGGAKSNQSTMPGVNVSDMNDILTNFSPISKGRDQINPDATEEIDLLIATDTISEGQNLQDADYLVNYDIHWNPVRVIQRFGRIDRIGSRNARIQLVNFWPNVDLDTYLNLEQRVKGRMVMLNTAATGEDDLLNIQENREMNDLKYRKQQLQQLQNEVIDLEDVSGTISITDMTFNDFKADLQNALKDREKDLNEAPLGMFAVASSRELPEAEPGVILVLKQATEDIGKENGILPYIVIYMRSDGSVKLNYMYAKQVLDYFKKLSLGHKDINQPLVDDFYRQTDGGKDMSSYSELLSSAIEAIRGKRDEVGIASMFSPGGTSVQTELVDDLEDIELISFLIIR
ncbi:helicase-related protein [Lacticaseibacillus saniviri]|uniref:Helicase n=2 Tax=Lacticaseibacillus saniviri TaxID=931533 RepID=A0A0R2N1V7_9LACO|nr:helicase-related protein [Lacticaseibacillus saniviri]KRO16986.1 helicase [Lacticaseibacillus saniviri JCM 17471 = DSM 24301]MCG4282291.1 DEAD/DEAH box helicase family protein [Lacticaseibacillus saniviri]